MKLVFIESNRPVTDSLNVAETFGKEHRRVLQDIRELGCSEEFRMHHFVHTPYVHPQNGQTYEKCLMTQEGFAFLAFGYTGREADKFKEMYINEFVRMRDELNKPQFALPQTMPEALRLLAAEMESKAIIVAEREQLAIESAEQKQILSAQAPKVALYETAMNASNNKSIGAVAKLIGYGPYKLFAFLREMKILRNNNEPYQAYIDRSYFDVRLYSISHTSGEIENKSQTLVTPKGIDYIHKLLVEQGKIPAKGA